MTDKIYVSGKRPWITDFNSLPLVDRSYISYSRYSKYIGMSSIRNSITIQATRGCPFKCAYCHTIWPKTHIVRSAENIFNEVKMYYDIGVKRFTFVDDIFNFDKKNSIRFYEMVIKSGIDVQFFFPGMRGDILTEDYIDLMVEAGTKDIALALETGSKRMQKYIRKNLNLDKFRRNCEYICNKYPQVIFKLYTMLGFPSETKEEATETLDFIKSLKWLHWPFVFVLKIYPNTPMVKLALESGITEVDIDQSLKLAYHQLPLTLPFDKNFAVDYQSDFFYNYFLSKERLLHVLPHQMNFYAEDEILQQYNAYLPKKFTDLNKLLSYMGIDINELSVKKCLTEDDIAVPDIDEKIKKISGEKKKDKDALKILMLDLSVVFSDSKDSMSGVIEPPLGALYLITYLDEKFGSRVKGKIAKSKIDFDSYDELKTMIENFKPDIIGMSTLSMYKTFFHEVVSKIRSWNINVPIISGGPYATSEYNLILKDENISLVVLGEGEMTFSELVKNILDNNNKLPVKEKLKHINGLAFVEKQTQSFAADDIKEYIVDKINESILSVLAEEDKEIFPDLKFSEYGIDSVVGVELIGVINKTLDIVLKTTALFDYPTVDQLSDFIAEEYGEMIGKTLNLPSDANTGETSAPEESGNKGEDDDIEGLLQKLQDGEMDIDEIEKLL